MDLPPHKPEYHWVSEGGGARNKPKQATGSAGKRFTETPDPTGQTKTRTSATEEGPDVYCKLKYPACAKPTSTEHGNRGKVALRDTQSWRASEKRQRPTTPGPIGYTRKCIVRSQTTFGGSISRVDNLESQALAAYQSNLHPRAPTTGEGIPEGKGKAGTKGMEPQLRNNQPQTGNDTPTGDRAAVTRAKAEQTRPEVSKPGHPETQARRDGATSTTARPGSDETKARDTPPQLHKRKPDIPSKPFDYVAVDYFEHADRYYLIAVDELSNWMEVMNPPPASIHPGSKGLIVVLRELFAQFSVPTRLSSDGGTEFSSKETQGFLKRWGVHHRLHTPNDNGKAEDNVEAARRMIRDNTRGDGSFNANGFTTALMINRESKISPAELARDAKPRDTPSDSLRYGKAETTPGDLARTEEHPNEGMAMQDQAPRNLEDPPAAASSRPKPLAERAKVRIQNLTGRAPLRWDRTGIIVRVLPFDQYIIQTYDLGRLAKRSRRFIRAYIPAPGKEQMRFDSAWAARVQRNHSADSSNNQGDTNTAAGTQAQVTTRPYPDSNPGRRSLETDQAETRQGCTQTTSRHSTHTEG